MRRFLTLFSVRNWMVFGALIIIAISICVVLFASTTSLYYANRYLEPVVNVLSLASMLFAALALLVSAIAYHAATAKPQLRLRIQVGWNDNCPLVLPVHAVTGQILPWAPESTWRLWITNSGSTSAQYTVVELSFDESMELPEPNGWSKVPWEFGRDHAFRWYAPENLVIHPNFPFELPLFSFSPGREHISIDPPANDTRIKITVAADGYWKEPIVKVVKLDYSVVNYEMEEWLIKALEFPAPSQFTAGVPGARGTVHYTSELSTQLGSVIPPTYDYLCGTHLARNDWWKKKFDEWKANGTVS